MSTEWQLRLKAFILDSLTFGFLFLTLYFSVRSPQPEELLILQYNLLILLIAVTLSCSLSFALSKLGIKTLGEAVFEPIHRRDSPKAWYRTFRAWQLLVWFVVTFWMGIRVTEFSWLELFSEEGFRGARRIFSSLSHPNLEILPHAILAIIETIFIAFIATVFAVPVAFLTAFFAAKNMVGNSTSGMIIYTVMRTLMNLTRSIEPLIWAIIFSVWVGIGPFAGMLALMLHSIASLTKQYSEIIECVSDGPIEGILSTGANRVQMIWFAVVPQIILPYVSFTIYRWDINVRMATIIGLVGGGGIGTMLIQYQGQAMWNEVGCLVLVIAVVVWLMDTASAYIREALK